MIDDKTELFIFQIIMIIILLYLIFHLIKVNKSLKYVRRIGDYGIDSVYDHDISLFDKTFKLVNRMIKTISRVLKKIKILVKRSKRYEKYIAFEDYKQTEAIDYYAIKLLIGNALLLLNIITSVFQYTKASVFMLTFAFVFGYFLYDVYLMITYRKYRKQIERDLLKAIIIMNNSFQSGRNIVQAIKIVISQLEGPIKDEFRKIDLDLSYGLSIDIVFHRFYERVELEDAKYMASSLTLLNKTGGNIVKVFNSIEKSIFDKRQLRDEIETMTSSSIFMFRILVSLPIVLILLIYILNPEYFKPLYSSVIGILIMFFTAILYGIYILIVRKILEVDI